MNDRMLALESKVASIHRLVILSLILGVLFNLARVFRVLPDYQPIPGAPSSAPGGGTAPSGNSNSVHIGSVPVSETRKDYFTTAEVAARENIAERTLLTWIAEGRLQPAPAKSNRAWLIPVNYRIQPPLAANNRN